MRSEDSHDTPRPSVFFCPGRHNSVSIGMIQSVRGMCILHSIRLGFAIIIIAVMACIRLLSVVLWFSYFALIFSYWFLVISPSNENCHTIVFFERSAKGKKHLCATGNKGWHLHHDRLILPRSAQSTSCNGRSAWKDKNTRSRLPKKRL